MLDTTSSLIALRRALDLACRLGYEDVEEGREPRTGAQVREKIKVWKFYEGHKAAIKAAYSAGRLSAEVVLKELQG